MTIGNPAFTSKNNPFDPKAEINVELGIHETFLELAEQSIHMIGISDAQLKVLRAEYKKSKKNFLNGYPYTVEFIKRSDLSRKRPHQRAAVIEAQEKMLYNWNHNLNTPVYVNVDKEGNNNVMEGQQHTTVDSILGDPDDMVYCIVYRDMPDHFEEEFFLNFNCDARTGITDYDHIRMMIFIERKTPTGNSHYEELEKKQGLFEQFNCRYLDNKNNNNDIACATSHSSIWKVKHNTLKEMLKFISNDDKLRKNPMIQVTWGFWELMAECGWLRNEDVQNGWRDLVLDMTGQQHVKSELTQMLKENERNWSPIKGPKLLMQIMKERGVEIDMDIVCNDNGSLMRELELEVKTSETAQNYVNMAQDNEV